ncbi:MAG: twin-arginine translocase TatA/TatE family subunit [Myxococcales bacterium]|nr:twin-arginine translocase TatA/TatE family subunit [Myxococcales bacterium]
MFGIGVPELVLIALVALVVVGPKNLPATLRAVGRAIREFQRATRELRREAGFDDVVDEVTRPLREGLAGLEDDVKREANDIEASVKKAYTARTVDLAMEYPDGGPDDYGALPEGAQVYPDAPQVLGQAEAEAREAEGPAQGEEVSA